MDSKKKTILAASLILLWAGLAVWQWRLLEEPVRVPLTNVSGSASSGRHDAMTGTGLRVNLGLLASTGAQRAATFTTPRNIFTVPRSDRTFPTSNSSAPVNQQGLAQAEPLMEQAEAMELGPYRYLGFLRLGEGRKTNKEMAVLSKEDEVKVLKVGDRIDGHLVLKAITSESVTIRDTGTRVDQTVSLSKEAKEAKAAVDQE
ncbi:MAG: hypothetical protein H8K03_17635 [Nitrospira sp.]|jgi:hypothetical protein|nr:hypothetical protein [Nitrospira sp. BO4]